jgi:hypothetical protein
MHIFTYLYLFILKGVVADGLAKKSAKMQEFSTPAGYPQKTEVSDPVSRISSQSRKNTKNQAF